jgi:3D (Asp-Asp-Asp) domain-containing protein
VKFGSVVRVPGYGRAVVADRGGSIKGNRLDVLFPTHNQALEWGVRKLKVSFER